MLRFYTPLCLVFTLQFASAQNVGIGTNTPAYPFTVVVPTNKGLTQIGGGSEIGFYTSVATAYLQTWSNDHLGFGTNGIGPQATLSTTGYFGIGVLPTRALDVNGNVRLQAGTPGTGKILTAIDANGNAEWKPADAGGTKTIFVPFSAFIGSSEFMRHETIGGVSRRSPGYLANDYIYQAPLLLPVGTLIKEITWHYFDNNVGLNMDFNLVKDYNGTRGNISQTSSSGALAFYWTRTATVNHTLGEAFYWLEIRSFSWSSDESLRFKGALITYE